MDFIDTHQHLIYRKKFGYGWTADIPALASGDFTLEDYEQLTKGKGIAGTLFMEAGVDDADYQAEARFVATLVGRHGLLGQIASCRPEDAGGFDAWLDECDGLKVHGFRRILHVMPDDLSQSDIFRRNLKAIGAKGLPFDMCFLARQLPVALALARACPDQPLVLDHCGVPEMTEASFGRWADDISALAGLPNVNCKLSGISAYCPPGTATYETLRLWINHVIDSFGPKRLVWGGDWPVVNLGVGLGTWIDLSRALLSGIGAADQMAVASANARRIYQLGTA